MAISSSAERAIAGVDIFSGRPNPTWPLRSSMLERIDLIWKRLPARTGVDPVPPTLGYRGCFVEADDRRWRIFGERVTIGSDGVAESRSDVAREIERLVIESAPPEIAALLESTAIVPK